ncbi:hypothetical protein [uncultured Psychroserpens sp.]|uniref:hypothetical protein n=1 Tax=uncultured Psychroserpens sp. TaxID=255436 RepID=UPI00262F75B6|nr:hypothetical protein [uncultured Psychroserpens sp.]
MKKIIIAFVIFQVLSCSKEKKDNYDKDKIIDEISEMFDNYHNDIRNDGLTAEFKYLDSTKSFFWVPPNYESALSYDSVKSILSLNSKSIKTANFSWHKVEFFPLSEKIASYSGIVNSEITDTTDSTATFQIIESGTVIKRKNDWKILNGQSAILPNNIKLKE